MKSMIKFLTGRGAVSTLILSVIASLALFSSCQDDYMDWSQENTYFGDGSGLTEIFAPVAGVGPIEYIVYTNMDVEWIVETDYQTLETDWITIWPDWGRKDGRFSITVSENTDNPYGRVAYLRVVSKSDGRPLQYADEEGDKHDMLITVRQAAVAPKLEYDADFSGKVLFGSKGGSKIVSLNTNVIWDVIIPAEDQSWISLGETDPDGQYQYITVPVYNGDSPRGSTIRFVMVGNENNFYLDVEVSQRDSSTDPENGTLTPIATLLSSMPEGGIITDNILVEGYVISDISSRNLDITRDWEITNTSTRFNWETDYQKKMMFLQDESGRGLMFEFADESLNTFPVNTKVKLHLIDMNLARDSYFGAMRIGGLLEENLVSHEASAAGATPVEINSFANIGNYENTLVTIKDVEFVLPIGTYVNIDEGTLNDLNTGTGSVNAVSSPFGDTQRQYAHLLRDDQDNTMKLLTQSTFIERYNRLMPAGKGSITGIVTKRKILRDVFNTTTQTYVATTQEEYVLRLRRDSDNAISNDASARRHKTVTQFGLYPASVIMSEVLATVGTGSIKTSVYKNILPSGGSTTNLYWSSSYTRMAPTTISIDSDGKQVVANPKPTDIEGFYNPCLNVNSWYESTSSIFSASMPVGNRGEAWIITTSTAGVTGDLWLSFATSSSATGPLRYCIEWTDVSETAPANQWERFEDYDCTNWSTNYHAPQFSFKVPDGAKNKSTVYFRHRVTNGTDEAGRRASNQVGGGGTNRIIVWNLSEKQ